jgi:5-deoxy-glucuronate isomerase
VTSRDWHLPAGVAATDMYAVEITPDAAGWTYSSLRVLNLAAGGEHAVETGDSEMLVLPLSGSATVSCDGSTFDLVGRAGVFEDRTDFAYLPRDTAATVASADGGRFALPGARCDSRSNARYGPAADVTVELRGAGPASRQVNAICMPETFPAQRLLVCEVLTPAGNWSSYPPHKHDDEQAGESVLEEIYYFQIRREAGVPGEGGVGFQRVYGPGIDVLAEVRDGDVVLVPHGWHGPSMAAPGYDMYYLNVMAGPSLQRSWTISLDPDHAWVRDGWAAQRVNPRLPMTGGSQP